MSTKQTKQKQKQTDPSTKKGQPKPEKRKKKKKKTPPTSSSSSASSPTTSPSPPSKPDKGKPRSRGRKATKDQQPPHKKERSISREAAVKERLKLRNPQSPFRDEVPLHFLDIFDTALRDLKKTLYKIHTLKQAVDSLEKHARDGTFPNSFKIAPLTISPESETELKLASDAATTFKKQQLDILINMKNKEYTEARSSISKLLNLYTLHAAHKQQSHAEIVAELFDPPDEDQAVASTVASLLSPSAKNFRPNPSLGISSGVVVTGQVLNTPSILQLASEKIAEKLAISKAAAEGAGTGKNAAIDISEADTQPPTPSIDNDSKQPILATLASSSTSSSSASNIPPQASPPSSLPFSLGQQVAKPKPKHVDFIIDSFNLEPTVERFKATLKKAMEELAIQIVEIIKRSEDAKEKRLKKIRKRRRH
jgi:hypothetical protein